jgi:hypothetical protein
LFDFTRRRRDANVAKGRKIWDPDFGGRVGYTMCALG